MAKLEFRAGREAYELIKNEGLSADMVKAVASAAGGPKWFSIYELTKYIISDFLIDRSQSCHFIGSSVGAWQMAAATTNDPASAMERLKRTYAGHIYSEKPDSAEISDACRNIIAQMISDQSDRIINNPKRLLHIIASRGKGLLSADNKIILGASFGTAALANMISRKYNDKFVERSVFSNTQKLPFRTSQDVLSTKQISIDRDNLISALQGSGAIPFMMEGIKNISGASEGTYWDGGITDYHISLPYAFDEPGIVLHPHFSPNVLAGWFDKKLPWTRRAIDTNMSKVLLMFPSQSFIQSLPRGQITDLKDFYHFADRQEDRVKYWNKVADRTKELAEELDQVLRNGTIMDRLKPY